ncbi:Hsp70 family protein [Dactylosporangium cerinum]|uniref:Hsp70 family protein n=1 Tax=Dactylosporangium cerinum TaxID=1434730 RepID=A0ABV9VR49_9ACTN
MQRLAIDFGTSNTVGMMTGPNGTARPLLFDASPLLPSAVFATSDGSLLVGADAERAAIGDPARFEGHPKRRIDDGVVWLGDREHPVAGLIGAVLARIAGEAVRVAGRPPDEVVLTHPAAWSRTRLGILADAAGRARLGPVSFVPEPVAAAAYFAAPADRSAPRGCVAVYDLGAGTFDITVIRPTGAGYEVLATDGLADVGGLDLDAAVVRHARGITTDAGDAWHRLDQPATASEQQSRQLLWQGARAVKEQLSRHATGELHLPIVDRRLHLTREEFDAAALPHLERTVALTTQVLRAAGLAPAQLAGVFLVGGSSRVPLAATLLHRALGIAPTVLDQPELVVAEGALLTLPQQGNASGSRTAPPPAASPAAPPTPPQAPPPHVPFPPPSPAPSKRPVRALTIAALAIVAAVAAGAFAIKTWSGNGGNSGSDGTTDSPSVVLEKYINAKLNTYDDNAALKLQCASPDLGAVDLLRDQVKDLETRSAVEATVSLADLQPSTTGDTATIAAALNIRVPESGGLMSNTRQSWQFGLTRTDGWHVCSARKNS